MAVQREPERFAYIDGLRGLAILGVLLVHFTQNVTVYGGAGPIQSFSLRTFANAGARGVQLFFMLSAFTLFASSKKRFASDSRPAAHFYVRRAFRILPLWWLAILLYPLLKLRAFSECVPSLLMYFGFIRYRPQVEVFGPGWSIFVEETFYVLLPLVFGWISGLRRAATFLAASCAAAILWDQLGPRLGVPTTNNFIALFPLGQWFCLAGGIFLYFLAEEPLFRSLVVDNRSWAPILDALTAVALFWLLRESYVVASLSLGALFVCCQSPHTLFGRLARGRVLGLFGVCCYSIYLFHLLLLIKGSPYFAPFYGAVGLGSASASLRLVAGFPVFAAVCLAVGLVSWHGFEKPCIALGKRVNSLLAA